MLVVQIVLCAGQLPILDSRCYLENGGSAENFIVSEDIRVNSVIGSLKINGDPSQVRFKAISFLLLPSGIPIYMIQFLQFFVHCAVSEWKHKFIVA